MGKIISILLLLLPCTVLAATDCRVTEYPDHYVVECIGEAAPTPVSMAAQRQALAQDQLPGQEQAAMYALAPVTEIPDPPPEQIVRNELAILHAAAWHNSRSGH